MRRLPARLFVASAVFSAALVVIAVLSVESLRRASGLSEQLARRQLEALEETERLDDLFFQKGFLANYLVTHDPRWLRDLEERRKTTEAWLHHITEGAQASEKGDISARLQAAYFRYDEHRRKSLEAYETARVGDSIREFEKAHEAISDVLTIAHALARASRDDLQATLAQNEGLMARSRNWIAALTAFTSLLGIGFGVWTARAIARPIYELILQVESAAPERVRLGTGAPAVTDELSVLTEHVTRLVARFDEQRRRLQQAEKMEALGEIAAKLAHEILNPVAGVKAAVQAMQRTTELPDHSRETLHEIDRSLSRIDGIMRRLVKYAKPLEPHRQPTAVAQIVASAVESASHELAACGVTVLADIPRLPPANVDAALMSQVLTNLIVNAAQASQPGSEVLVRARQQGRGLEVQVIDHGRGLPANREKLFRPFFTTREQGHGLGLAASQNIVAEHGGSIEARDTEGGAGATFVVSLPQEDPAWTSPS